MASTDPKNTRGAGPTSDRENYDTDEDPLVELARIVSEDAGFTSRLTEKPRVPRVEPAAEPDVFSSDLEAELMQELETSFAASARRAPRATPEPAPPAPVAEPEEAAYPMPADEYARPAGRPDPTYAAADLAQELEPRAIEEAEPAAGRDDPEDLLRSIEQQLSQFERRVRSDSFADEGDRLAADENASFEPREDLQEAARPAAHSEYRFRGPAAGSRDLRYQPDDDVTAPEDALEVPTSVVGAAQQAAYPASMAERADDTHGEPDARAGETVAAEDVDTEGWGKSDRFDRTRETPGVADLAGLEAELSRELDPAYRGGDVGWDDPGVGSQDDGPRVAPAAVIAPEHGMRPPPRPAAPQPRGRSTKGLAMAAGILIVVALGGAGALYLRSVERAPSGPPPVIAAQEGPVKIEPAAPSDASEEETVGEAVYNRVAGRATDAEENVVDGAEEPEEIARIVPPPQMNSDEDLAGPVSGEDADVPRAGSGEEEFGPRRVPTYVVRPDGTIVATADAGSSALADASGQDLVTAQTEAVEPKPVETIVIDEPRTAGTPAAPAPLESVAPATADQPTVSALEAEPVEEAGEAPTEIAALESAPETPAGAAADEAPASAPVSVAAAPVPPTDPSGYLVQIASQTSREAAEATFAAMQQRYDSILGGLQADIQRADLGERGIYYRVRIGPWSERAEAVEVCESLRAAGADCFVAQ